MLAETGTRLMFTRDGGGSPRRGDRRRAIDPLGSASAALWGGLPWVLAQDSSALVPGEHGREKWKEPLSLGEPRLGRRVVALPDDGIRLGEVGLAQAPGYDRLVLVHEHEVAALERDPVRRSEERRVGKE